MATMLEILLLVFSTTSLAAQPSAPAPPRAQLRELVWGQLNFLHTTDTHGWHGGHLQEPSYSADWGDYISFAHHMRKHADDNGVDLLLVDTGDRIEGNGLYDASEPQGKYTYDIFKHQKIDVICSGNHELYKANSSNNEFYITVPNFKGSYLASNLDVRNNKTGKFEALAPRYKTFTTKNQGIRILAFGFIYNFQRANEDAKVIPVKEAIKKKWFQDAIREDVDLFLVTGHVAIRSEEFDLIFKAIRSQNFDAPIMILGGHTHIRDYKQYDNKAYALESGRYMETIGWAAISGLNSKKGGSDQHAKASLNFKRRYIDNNLFSLYHHSGLNESTFPTKLGKNVTNQIAAARSAMGLDDVRGCAPRDLWLNRAKFGSKHSIFTWIQDQVTPDQFHDPGHTPSPKLVITNTGAVRFDVFKGPYTRDTSYLISPFTSGYKRLSKVQSTLAFKLIDILNNNADILHDIDPSLDPSLLMPPRPEYLMGEVSDTPVDDATEQHLMKETPALTPGYTTKDDAGTDGDDTIHSKIKYYSVPNCIQSKVDFLSDEAVDQVDVVYNDFLEPWILLSLQLLGQEYDESDATSVLNGSPLNSIIGDWVGDNWPCEDKDEL